MRKTVWSTGSKKASSTSLSAVDTTATTESLPTKARLELGLLCSKRIELLLPGQHGIVFFVVAILDHHVYNHFTRFSH